MSYILHMISIVFLMKLIFLEFGISDGFCPSYYFKCPYQNKEEVGLERDLNG